MQMYFMQKKKKDRNDMDLTETVEVVRIHRTIPKKKKKNLHDPDNQDGVITHLEPDILE